MLLSGLAVEVAGDEVIARHGYTDRHITSDPKDHKKKWAKPQAFLPLFSETDGWVFSVSRTTALKDAEAIQRNGLGIGKASKRSYKGSAQLLAQQIREVGMKVSEGDALHRLDVVSHEAADGTTPYHAHITGFQPLPEGANIKEFFKEASADLAKRAKEHDFILCDLPEQDGEMHA